MEKIITVLPLPDGHVFVTLADGRSGKFDVRPYMKGPFFEPLLDTVYFSQVRTIFRGIGWPNGQDIGPDTIAMELMVAEETA